MRAAIYARVSTEDQAKDGFSIAAQVKQLNASVKRVAGSSPESISTMVTAVVP